MELGVDDWAAEADGLEPGAALEIPDDGRAVPAGAQQEARVAAPADALDLLGVTSLDPYDVVRQDVPDRDAAVGPADGDERARKVASRVERNARGRVVERVRERGRVVEQERGQERRVPAGAARDSGEPGQRREGGGAGTRRDARSVGGGEVGGDARGWSRRSEGRVSGCGKVGQGSFSSRSELPYIAGPARPR